MYNRYDEGGYLIWFAPEQGVSDGRRIPIPSTWSNTSSSGAARLRTGVSALRHPLAYVPADSPVSVRLLRTGDASSATRWRCSPIRAAAAIARGPTHPAPHQTHDDSVVYHRRTMPKAETGPFKGKLQGTLDLLILKTLAIGAAHGQPSPTPSSTSRKTCCRSSTARCTLRCTGSRIAGGSRRSGARPRTTAARAITG